MVTLTFINLKSKLKIIVTIHAKVPLLTLIFEIHQQIIRHHLMNRSMYPNL